MTIVWIKMTMDLRLLYHNPANGCEVYVVKDRSINRFESTAYKLINNTLKNNRKNNSKRLMSDQMKKFNNSMSSIRFMFKIQMIYELIYLKLQ